MFDEEDMLLATAAFIVIANRKTKRPRIFWFRPTLKVRENTRK
jgi:hypothetical protein